tara:strand:+ start:260 stop:706 length:447 start_codon:yes stop_codon:yes gene_type:complete
MSGIKNEYHYYISPTVNVWRENVPEGFTLGMHPLDITVITEDIVRWCCHHFEMEVDGINVTLHDEYKDKDCWGQCWEKGSGFYGITVCTAQSFRNFVATLIHEMVHVKQYVLDDWDGDGEEECEKKQYVLADMWWNQSVYDELTGKGN